MSDATRGMVLVNALATKMRRVGLQPCWCAGQRRSEHSYNQKATGHAMVSLPVHTPSLSLRHIVVEEAVRMMELNGEPSTRRWLPSHVYTSEREATERMRYLIACYALPGDPRLGPYVLAVEHRDTGALLGHVGFSPFDGDVEVSYAIAEHCRRRGYGAEGLYHGCKWAASHFGIPRLRAITESENAPSRRTLERAGFVHGHDAMMRFQGSEQSVSHYLWRPIPESEQGQ